MPLLLAAPDKFRGSATAGEVADAATGAARRAGWEATALPLSDGGEGLLEAVGGERRHELVTGPLGEPVEAEWRLLGDEGRGGPTAVVEMARASGLELAGGAGANDPIAATTRGTGELVAAALRAGARRVVVGCGGSATTDGGAGALGALEELGLLDAGHRLAGARLYVATDVRTAFLDAARVYGPQKGAGPGQLEALEERLAALAERYRELHGVDVSTLPGAGAAGGLAGGLAAVGGEIVSGFDLVAGLVGLDAALGRADLVVTGEGRLDLTSLEGKVVAGVLRRLGGRAPALVVVGDVADGLDHRRLAVATGVPEGRLELVTLLGRFGRARSFSRACELVAQVVSEHLGRM